MIKWIIKKIVPIVNKIGIKDWCILIFLSNFSGIIAELIIKVSKQGITVNIGNQTFPLNIRYKDKQCSIQNKKTGKEHK